MGKSGDCRLYLIRFPSTVFQQHLIELIGLLLELDLIDRGLGEYLVAHQMLVLV